MNDNFNLRQFLTENRLTKASQVLAEAENPANVNKWKGTFGRELMSHIGELKDLKSNEDIENFLADVEPQLSKEAKAYAAKVKSEIGTSFERNLRHLYNIILAGEGLRAPNAKGRDKKNENMDCKYSLQEVRKNYRKFLREGIGKRKAIALLSKVYPGLNLMEALMDDSRTRSLRESTQDDSIDNIVRLARPIKISNGKVHFLEHPYDISDPEEAEALRDEEEWVEDVVKSSRIPDGNYTYLSINWDEVVDELGDGDSFDIEDELDSISDYNGTAKWGQGMGDTLWFFKKRSLREAGYTDDDDDDEGFDLDIDIDPKAKTAAEKAMRAAGEYEDFDDDPEDKPKPEEDDDDDDDEKAPAKEEPADDIHAKGHWNIKYDPETVTLNFEDDEELQKYLNHFRRPRTAAKYLQRKLNAAQYEIDQEDPEIGATKTYLQLKDGLYFNYPFKRSDAELIATVRRHKDANI